MKNWNIWYLAGILAVLYFGSGMFEKLKSAQEKTTDQLIKLRAEVAGIGVKLQSDEQEKANFYKLQKNQDIWEGTGCAQCHNTIATALPIHKISVARAIEIVRYGTPESRAAGMPIYTPRATRDKNSITDADLKVRLDALYVKEFLDYAKPTTKE